MRGHVQLCAMLPNLTPGRGHKHHIPSFTTHQLPSTPTATFLAGESRTSLLQPLPEYADKPSTADDPRLRTYTRAMKVSWYTGPGSDNLMHRTQAVSWERLGRLDGEQTACLSHPKLGLNPV